MSAFRLAWCLAFAGGLACAQTAPTFEIRGVVVEKGVGVASATVTLYESGTDPVQATTRTVFAATSTDSKGGFVFHPARSGEFYLEVNKEGYFAESFDGPTADPIEIIGDSVSIDIDHPSTERRFSLARLGEVRGRVIDEDGMPLADLRIGFVPPTSAQVATDQDGYFVATRLRPGYYVVRIGPERRSPEVMQEFSERDLTGTDHDIETSFWPGSGDLRAASPLNVTSGASLSVGTITARRATYFRAHISVQPSACGPDENWLLTIRADEGSPLGPSRQVPCGQEFLVRNLIPGFYSFVLSTDHQVGKETRWALARAEVRDQNVEVTMTMAPGADISGRLVAAEGAALPGKTTVGVTPVLGGWGFVTLVSDQEHTFQLHSLPGERSRVWLNDMGDEFYVKEIRYNGISVADGVFAPVAGPTNLEIVIDDKAATIGGSIADHDNVVGRVMVVAVRWPLPLEGNSVPAVLGTSTRTPADDLGRFHISGLAPGDYRVFGMTEDMVLRLNSDNLSRQLDRAEKVTLGRADSQSVTLKIIEP